MSIPRTRVDAPRGPAGDDTLIGTPGDDTIFGGLGRDDIFGRAGNDLLHGEDDNDRVFGETGDDRLLGGSGNDTLQGGAGADLMQGQDGNDLYVVDDAGDTVFEGVNMGREIVYSFISYTLPGDVEDLQLSGRRTTDGVGNARANVLVGNLGDFEIANRLSGGAGRDRLYGRDGNDILVGGADGDQLYGGTGADVMDGGAGDDLFFVDDPGDRIVERAGQGIDFVYSALGRAMEANVENLALTGSLDERVFGNAEDNRIFGNAGRNILEGRGGNDRLDGGSGADALAGGIGDDIYDVDDPSDRVIERTGEGIDLIYTASSERMAANVENLILTGGATAKVFGNDEGNIIRGNTGRNILFGENGDDELIGAGGADVLIGGLGKDILRGGADADRFLFRDVSETPPGAGRDVIRDFQAGLDRIDLRPIDKPDDLDGEQTFTYIGRTAYSGAVGELRYDRSVLRGDVDGDGVDDFQIAIANNAALTADDFLL